MATTQSPNVPYSISIPSSAPTSFLGLAGTLSQIMISLNRWISQAANAINASGAYVSAVVLSPGASLTSNLPAQVTSLALTPGDWDVWGECWFDAVAGTTITTLACAISASALTIPVNPADGTARSQPGGYASGVIGGASIAVGITPCRVSISANTTYYMNVDANFSGSTLSVYGILRARSA